MSKNKLVLNGDKTHLLVMATSQKHLRNGDFNITLDTGNEVIEPIYSEKLLGGHITNDFKWNEHIRNNEKSLFRLLTSRINALGKISSISTFKTRKMIANGIVMSLLVYLIHLWGGAADYLITFLQVLQNRAARLVTKLGWFTPTKVLLTQCGWLSVRQLVEYHSLLLVYKIRSEGKPVYLKQKLCNQFSYNTRLSRTNGIKLAGPIKSELHKQSFIPRASNSWNKLPGSLRVTSKTNVFKGKLKSWVKENVPIQ